jgi:O-antigen ligase
MMKIKPVFIIIYFGIVLLGMWEIKHMASIAVFFVVVALFLRHDIRRRVIQIVLYSIITIVVVLMYGDKFYQEVINPRVEKEVEVLEGQREQSQAFHGRMSRWTWLWGEWKRAGIFPKMIGYPWSMGYSRHMVGITVHNDFLRMFFFTGIIGFIVYLIFLGKIIRRIKYLNKADKFISVALLMSLLLYSMTTLPTIYVGFMNVYVTLFAYLALPQQVLLKYKYD